MNFLKWGVEAVLGPLFGAVSNFFLTLLEGKRKQAADVSNGALQAQNQGFGQALNNAATAKAIRNAPPPSGLANRYRRLSHPSRR
jgi:hypothetical protein